MSDILETIVAVKHQEVAAARKRKSLEAVRQDAESRELILSLIHIPAPTRLRRTSYAVLCLKKKQIPYSPVKKHAILQNE